MKIEMTIDEMIAKWRIVKHPGDKMQSFAKKFSPKEVQMLTDAKPAILAELTRREVEKAEKETAEKARKEEEKRAILVGEKIIELFYHDGEYLSGWVAHGGEASNLLEEIGAAKYVTSWGHLVDSGVFTTLGKSFTYPQVVEYMRPAKEAKEKKAEETEAKRQEKFAEAKATGKRVEITYYATECDDPNEECDIDIITKYAMPDGTTKTTRGHSW